MSDSPSRRPPPGPPPAWVLSAQEYAGLGVVGTVLFVLGVWSPFLAGVPEAEYLRLLLAIAGGFLMVLGWGRWNVLRRYPGGGGRRPARGVAEAMPSFRSYSPGGPSEDDPRRRLTPPARLPFTAGDGSGWGRSGIVGVATLLLVGLVLSGIPATTNHAASPAAPAAVTAGTPSGALPTAAPVAAITCTPFYPVYTSVNGLYPPLPKYSQQSPCKISDDQVHATFSSSVSGSGSAVLFPIHLPGNGTDDPATTYAQFDLGMVVQGNPTSVDGQSYAELDLTPGNNQSTGAVDWDLSVAIWSLEVNTTCGSGLNFTWQTHYGCVVNDVRNGAGADLETDVPGNTSANVTFVGSPTRSSQPLSIWFNDTTSAKYSTRWTANVSSTGNQSFQPYFSTACPDTCDLNWSMGFGLGLGAELCDSYSCFSYNATTQLATVPFEVGSPEFWTGLSYAGDYRYVTTESSTGACGSVGGVPPCGASAEVGEYPMFTFNGTTLQFGGNYSWATENFGGVLAQFNGYATGTDFTPLFLDMLTNSSRAGYVVPGLALNVSVRAQDLGTVSFVNLSYQVPGGGLTNHSMRLISGTSSDGIYNASVPAAGANGTISFRTEAGNRAGATVFLPPLGSPALTVVRSAIPTVSALLGVTPPTCGGVSVNGTALQPNGTVVDLSAGTYALRASGCYTYDFTGWHTTGGLSVPAGAGPSTEILLHANGTVTATWVYVVPHDVVDVAFSPHGCGEVVLNGSTIRAASAGPVPLLDAATYSLSDVSCGGHSFSGWQVSNPTNLSILGDFLTLHGNGTLTATFVPTSTSAPVLFVTAPAYCGGVLVNSVGYVDNESLNLVMGDSYPIAADPCSGWGFNGNVTTSGSVVVQGGRLGVSGPGVVTYSYYKLTLVEVLTNPGNCGGINWDGTFEANGAILNVTNHTVHSILAEPCAGHYVEGFQLTGGVTLSGTVLTVSGPGSIEAVFRAGTEQFFVGFITQPLGCGAVEFDGSAYSNSEYADVLPDSEHTVSAVPCTDYGFVGWSVSGGVTIVGSDAYVNQSGSIEAIFHPLVSVTIETTPSTCGAVLVAGSSYISGTIVLLAEDASYPVNPAPCLNYVLTTWETSGGATIANGTLTLTATAIVVAQYIPAVYHVAVYIDPGTCGQVSINSVSYANNSSVGLTAAAYPVSSQVCPGYELISWETSGGLSLSAGSLDVQGSGNLTELVGPVPPTLSLSAPTSIGVNSPSYFTATVATPVPPFNYSYSWNFGDGSQATTPSNFTSHSYGSPGVYRVTVTVTDPFGRTANASENVSVVAGPGAAYFGIGPLGIALIVVAAAVVVLGAGVSVVRARRPPPGESTGTSGNVSGGGNP
jgi:hypothetical protein